MTSLPGPLPYHAGTREEEEEEGAWQEEEEGRRNSSHKFPRSFGDITRPCPMAGSPWSLLEEGVAAMMTLPLSLLIGPA